MKRDNLKELIDYGAVYFKDYCIWLVGLTYAAVSAFLCFVYYVEGVLAFSVFCLCCAVYWVYASIWREGEEEDRYGELGF